MRENLLVRLSALGHHVRAFLAEAETVAKATATKYKLRSRSRNIEARAFQNVPTERATDDQLEFPAVYRLSSISAQSRPSQRVRFDRIGRRTSSRMF